VTVAVEATAIIVAIEARRKIGALCRANQNGWVSRDMCSFPTKAAIMSTRTEYRRETSCTCSLCTHGNHLVNLEQS
jgi:hypothetical protein